MMCVLKLIKKNMMLMMSVLAMVFSGALFGLDDYNPFLKGSNGQPELVVLVPSYNNEGYCYPNLNSIAQQNVPFRVIYINDCSTDKTGQFVDFYTHINKFESQCTVIHNEKRVGALANLYKIIHTLPDHAIVVLVDEMIFLHMIRFLSECCKNMPIKIFG